MIERSRHFAHGKQNNNNNMLVATLQNHNYMIIGHFQTTNDNNALDK